MLVNSVHGSSIISSPSKNAVSICPISCLVFSGRGKAAVLGVLEVLEVLRVSGGKAAIVWCLVDAVKPLLFSV